ncbi:GerMN domain-containing protein [Serinibacter salmoneus]|uniref:Sporulation and spore germination protein n=1 Tax=Serinibacter salmoneus TaxID=556530 RepID=A0A2A9D119_9MICO|nr:GerMN domain-containing protein [Serinibacter salmoneus]PFG20333.1 sporulation and spore germination protein [Serinibacter salmoneus]
MRTRLARLAPAAAALCLAACASLPTEGPVEAGRTEAPAVGSIQYDATAPGVGDSPVEIVQGFLQAGAAGLTGEGDFEVARTYLTPEASATWSPLAEVVVTAADRAQEFSLTRTDDPTQETGEPVGEDAEADREDTSGADPGSTAGPSQEGAGAAQEETDPAAGAGAPLDAQDIAEASAVTVTLSATAVADVDEWGAYTGTAGVVSEIAYDLVRLDGEWRLATLPDGLVLSEVTFASAFRPVSLAFLSADLDTVVPDLRYVPIRNSTQYAVELLLAGPVAWLAPAVATRVPDGLTLDPAAGVVYDETTGEVSVRFTTPASAVESDQARELMVRQVARTLLSISGVRTVSIWMAGTPYEPTGDGELTTARVTGSDLVAVQEGRLVTLTRSGEVSEYAPAGTAGGDLADLAAPAPSPGGAGGVAVAVPEGIARVLPSGAVDTLLGGEDLLAPAADSSGWVWSGSGEEIVAVSPGGYVTVVAARDLVGRLTRIELAPDGTRAILALQGEQGEVVQVASVVRGEDGEPIALQGGPVIVPAVTRVLDLAWSDAVTAAALLVPAESASVLRSVVITGPTSSIATPAQAVGLTAGSGALVVSTEEGRVLEQVGSRWEEFASDVSDPAFVP